MASKVHVAKFPLQMHDFNDLERTRMRSTLSEEWEEVYSEEYVLECLYRDDFGSRMKILENLMIHAKRNDGILPYQNQALFEGLAEALTADHWEIRNRCMLLITELIPKLGDDLEPCMSVVMSEIVPNIGDTKITVRRSVINLLHCYMKFVDSIEDILHSVVAHGLEHDDLKIRRETINALPVILTREFANGDIFEPTQALAKKLIDSSVDDNLSELSFITMLKIEEFVGEREFNTYIQRLSAPLRRYFLQLRQNGKGKSKQKQGSSNMNGYHYSQVRAGERIDSASPATYMDSYEFGLIPSHVMSQLNDHDNFRVRAQAVEELKGIIESSTSRDLSEALFPHMIHFISFLNNLLADTSFKIVTATLEILCILVEIMGGKIKHFVKPLVLAVSKHLGDSKIVVRCWVMKAAMKMMRSYAPQPVLDQFCENLRHRNSRVRQETINIVIAALMTFPSSDFALCEDCVVIGPSLTDPKRQVRQAALECFAALAQAMGAGRLHPLVHAVDNVELNTDREGEGLMAAVQARLARRTLPKLNQDGLVEYATPIPASATHRSMGITSLGADVDWILAVGGGNGSARSTRTDIGEVDSMSARNASHQQANPRRYMSAGKGRNKLPWENEEQPRRGTESSPSSASVHGHEDPGPPRPRVMFSNENLADANGNDAMRRVPQRRQTVVGIRPADEPDTGSYRQMYIQNKNKQPKFQTRPAHLESLDAQPSTSTARNIRENGSTRSDFKSPRPFLDPIRVDNTPNEDRTDVDESPVHVRPTLVRGSSSSSSSRRISTKAPPAYQPERYTTVSKEEDTDSAYAPSLEGTLDFDQDQEMGASLRGIRNSASKKKKERKQELQKQNSQKSFYSSEPSTSDAQEYESGVYSSRNDLNGNKKAKRNETPSPFQSKPKLVRSGIFNKPSTSFDNPDDAGSHSNYGQFNGGATFPANSNSDVQIVGKGYSDDSSSETQLSPALKPRATKRVKPKSVFDASTNGFGTDNASTSSQVSSDPPVTRASVKVAPKGVYGVGVKSNTQDTNSYSSFNSQSDDETARNDSPPIHGVRMTKPLQEQIRQKQLLRQEELEQKRLQKERKEREKEERMQREKERQKEKLRKLSSDHIAVEDMTINGYGSSQNVAPNTAPNLPPPAVTPRKKIIKASENVANNKPMPAQPNTPPSSDNPEDWKPMRDPDAALKDALRKLSSDDWEEKCTGINKMRQISLYHPETIIGSLHTVAVAMNAEVKNLRSQVSRLAIVGLADFYTNLKRGIDPDLDCTTRTLLAKSAESNSFIKEVVEKALSAMVENVTPQRALQALILGGATHKSTGVRKMTAMFLAEVVEKMGPGRLLSGIKDVTDKLLQTAANFTQDGSQETRYYGRKILYTLMSHQDFDKIIQKNVPSNSLRSVKETIENLRQKGLGDMPSESSSARSRRSGHGSRSNSTVRSNSANRTGENQTTPQMKRRVIRTDAATQEEINQMMNLMSASNWQDRHKAIQEFQELCETNPNHVVPNIVRIFDKFAPRLVDSNSKVNLFALHVLNEIIPLLKDSLHQGPVLNIAISNVVPNLSSKNREINDAAKYILETFIQHIDPCYLIEPFASSATSAAPRSKPEVVEKVAYLVDQVYPKKPKLVILRVLPLLWHLLKSTNSSGAVHGGSGDIRTASIQLSLVLHNLMGQSLIDKAQAEPNLSARHVDVLRDLLNL